MSTRKARPDELARTAATPEQLRCWDCLSSVVGGSHHLGLVRACGFGIRTTLHGEAATFDGDLMTRLVLAAHRDAVRIAIESSGPHRIGVTAHPRRHGEGNQFERHPSLADLARRCAEMDEKSKSGGR